MVLHKYIRITDIDDNSHLYITGCKQFYGRGLNLKWEICVFHIASKIIKYDNLSFFVYSICFISITQNKRLICGQHRYSAVTCIVFR